MAEETQSSVAPLGEAGAPSTTAPPASDSKMEPQSDKPVAPEEGESSTAEKEKANTDGDVVKEDAKDDMPIAEDETKAKASAPTESTDEKPAEKTETTQQEGQAEAEKKAAEDTSAPAAATEEAAPEAAGMGTPASDKKARRKSSGVADKKKLNKKASKAKILHLDAQPGDHFFAKLKGFPPWPIIICDDSMLPQTMLQTRPVTAARPDGTYREDFADGGKRAAERTYPVMYLHTNEFSWTRNSDLDELDASTVRSLITPKMRKDLQQAHILAEEKKDLDYYKEVLREFEEQRLEALEAKAAKAKTKKEKAKKPESAPAEDDEDVEMPDAEEAAEETEAKKPKSKKRKAEEGAETPQRSDSVKKPKIKLTTNSTPKPGANGVQSPKSAKDSTSKPVKVKSKNPKTAKETDGKKAEKETPAPKEPEMTPEERRARKEKEILFLRHRLQKGLLNRDAEPKEAEMKPMSDYLSKLETFPTLEVNIIRATKINKVLKAILKLDGIPKEEEFKFKPRSQALLDKWNKILTSETAGSSTAANGVNGTLGESATNADGATNGVKQNGDAEAPKDADQDESKEKPQEGTEEDSKETKDESTSEEKPAEAATAEPAAAETAA